MTTIRRTLFIIQPFRSKAISLSRASNGPPPFITPLWFLVLSVFHRRGRKLCPQYRQSRYERRPTCSYLVSMCVPESSGSSSWNFITLYFSDVFPLHLRTSLPWKTHDLAECFNYGSNQRVIETNRFALLRKVLFKVCSLCASLFFFFTVISESEQFELYMYMRAALRSLALKRCH